MVPLATPLAEVCARAKKDLSIGEQLDQIGEYCYRAWIMDAIEARTTGGIPCGLLAGSVVTKTIRKGDLITYDNTTLPTDSKIVKLRTLQDQMIFGR